MPHLTEQQLRTLTELVPTLLWVVDAQGGKVWLNARWREYTGQTVEQTQNGGWLTVIHPDDAPESADAMAKAYECGQPLQLEHRLRGHDGEYRWFLVHLHPVADERGDAVQWLGAATDIHLQHTAMSDLSLRVDERTSHLRQLLLHLENVQDEERRRLARDLHDSVGQHMALALLLLPEHLPPEDVQAAGQRMGRLRELMLALDSDLHRVLFLLRPAGLDEVGLFDGVTAYLASWSELSNLQVDFECDGLQGIRLPDAIEAAVFRLVQESLNNVVKHASASNVSITLARRRDELVGSVEDDGCGFDAQQAMRVVTGRTHWGLLGMQERMNALGGVFSVESRLDGGTAVLWRVPLHA